VADGSVQFSCCGGHCLHWRQRGARGARRTVASTRVDTAPAMAEAAAWEMNGENRRSDTEGMGNKNLVA